MHVRLAARALPFLALVATPALAETRIFEGDGVKGPKSIDLFAWIQPRFTHQQRDTRPGVSFEPNPAFTVTRARLGLKSEVTDYARAVMEIEIAGQQPTPLLDAYLVLHPIPEAQLWVGQMRVPFSRQNLIQSTGYQFPDVAYFVTPKYLVDRDMGAMAHGSVFDDRARYFVGVFNGNEPGRGLTQNQDRYFLTAMRLEVSPLGKVIRTESDLRSPEERRQLRFTVGGGAMQNRASDKNLKKQWVGGDLAAYFRGASLYAEVYRRVDTPIDAAKAGVKVTATGLNVQVGYFAPIGWVERHVEVVARFQTFDPFTQTKHPPNADPSERDLDSTGNPSWGYRGFVGGVNVFPNERNDVVFQASYEVRNETKPCLVGQSGATCTGTIKNNLFVAQATFAF